MRGIDRMGVPLADMVHDVNNVGASISSGSFRTAGMVIAPCSMKSMGGIAQSLGGDLLVDLPTQAPGPINHCQLALKFEVVHPATVVPDTGLAAIWQKSEIGVNSTHHQAIRTLAAPLRVAAASRSDSPSMRRENDTPLPIG